MLAELRDTGMKDKLIKTGACLFGVLGIIDLSCMLLEKCGITICLSPCVWLLSVIALSALWYFIDGKFVSGFLVKRIEINLSNLRTRINVFSGDLLDQRGCAIVPANDFFDNVVNESIVAAKSIDGQMIMRFWAGNGAEMDEIINEELNGRPFVEEKRVLPAKNRRYAIGTNIVLKVRNDFRVIWVALTHTDITTNKTHAEIEDLQLAIRSALVTARNKGNGDVLNVPLMGGGLSRIGLNSSFLLNLLIGLIVDESKKESVTETINIVLTRKVINELNLLEVKKNWEG